MSWADVTFTFPFTIPTLIVAIIAYLVTSPLFFLRIKQKQALWLMWLFIAILVSLFFSWGYALRFLLAVAMMLASRMRLTQIGLLKEVLMLVITLVTAMLFVGLR